MEKRNDFTTAANSKTMNSVEGAKLFAAAAEEEQVINFTEPESSLSKGDSSKKRPGKKKRK